MWLPELKDKMARITLPLDSAGLEPLPWFQPEVQVAPELQFSFAWSRLAMGGKGPMTKTSFSLYNPGSDIK